MIKNEDVSIFFYSFLFILFLKRVVQYFLQSVHGETTDAECPFTTREYSILLFYKSIWQAPFTFHRIDCRLVLGVELIVKGDIFANVCNFSRNNIGYFHLLIFHQKNRSPKDHDRRKLTKRAYVGMFLVQLVNSLFQNSNYKNACWTRII